MFNKSSVSILQLIFFIVEANPLRNKLFLKLKQITGGNKYHPYQVSLSNRWLKRFFNPEVILTA
jgi:hypothetical protein